MLRAVGLSDADIDRPQVAVASSWNEVTPCNLHLGGLAAAAKDGVRQAGAVPFEFGTIAVSDGISMGTEGMKSSLVSREVIADSVELMVHAEQFDALVADRRLRQVAAGHADGVRAAGRARRVPVRRDHPAGLGARAVTDDPGRVRGGRQLMPRGRCRTASCTTSSAPPARAPGSCAGMYTANTMSACAEALGMALPGSATAPAVSAERTELARRTGEIAVQALAAGLRPRQIMTRAAFLNAAAVVMATAGSTNAVLHLLAIANEAEVELTLDDFDAISRRTPHIVSMRPAGRFVMSELDQAGGLPVVLRELLSAGLIDGDALSVNGKTLAQNVQDAFDPGRRRGPGGQGPVQAGRRPGRPARLAGAERRRGQDPGHRDAAVRGPRAGIRAGRGLHRRGHRAARSVRATR